MKSLLYRFLKLLGFETTTLEKFRYYSQWHFERFPAVDKVNVYMFYRFAFFRNSFLNRTRYELGKETATPKSELLEIPLDRRLLDSLKRDGVTQTFRIKPEMKNTFRSILENHPLVIDGKLVKKSFDEILAEAASPTGKKLHGCFQYKDLMRDSAFMDLGAEPAIMEFVRSYLQSDEIYYDAMAKWSFPNLVPVDQQDTAIYDNAQKYHYDHVGRRILKLFIYLTDVDTESGPHCYVKGSSISKPMGWQIREPRLTEQDVMKVIDPKDLLVVEGPAGTAFFGDPFGIHRGLEPKTKPRLMAAFNYSVDRARPPTHSKIFHVSELIRDAAGLATVAGDY